MNRRKLVQILAGSLTVAIAGCTGDGDDDADGESGTDGSNGEATTDDSNGGAETDDSNGDSPMDTDDSTHESEPELTTLESITAVEDRYDENSQTFSGSESKTTDEFDLDDSITVLIAEHDGDEFFSPELGDDGRLRRFLPVSGHGEYEGTGAVGVPADTYHFVVDASGDWSVEIAQPESPAEAVHQLPVEVSGDGQDVVGPVEIPGQATVRGTYEDETGFFVEALDEAGRGERGQTVPVFDEVGEFEGQEVIQMDAVCWFHVIAETPWTLEIE